MMPFPFLLNTNMADTARTIKVTIDSSGAVSGANRLKTTLNDLAKQGKIVAANNNELSNSLTEQRKGFASAESAVKRATGSLEKAGNQAKSASTSISGMTGSLGALKTVIAALGIGYLTKEFMSLSDSASMINAKLTLATAKFGSFSQANNDVIKIAQRTRSDITAVADLYGTMARNGTQLGMTQAQVATATQTVGMALKISGANAQQSAAAILQLSQSLGSGKLAGDEFASLMENAPRLMQIFANSMGVPQGSLKKLASEGKITGEVMKKALTDPKLVAGIEKEYGKIPVTFSDIGTTIKNTAIRIAGSFASGFGITDSLAVIITKVNNWTDSMVPTFKTLATEIKKSLTPISEVFGAIMSVAAPVFQTIITNLSTITNLAIAGAVAWTTYAVLTNGAAIATGVLSTAQGVLNAVMAVNPFILIGTAIAGAVTLLYEFRDSIILGSDGLTSLGDYGRAAWDIIKEGASTAASWVQSVWEPIGSFFSGLASGISSTATWVGGVISSVAGGAYGVFVGLIKAYYTYYTGLFKAVMTVVTNIANSVISLVESTINKIIGAVNTAIYYANKAGANFTPFANVSLGKLAGGGAVTLGKDVGKAFMSGFNNGFNLDISSGFKPLSDKAKGYQKARAAQSAREAAAAKAAEAANNKNNSNPASTTPSALKDDKSNPKKSADEAARKLKAGQDFWDGLKNELTLSKMTTAEAERQSKMFEYQKATGEKLVGLELEKLTTMLNQIKANKFMTSALESHNAKMLDIDKEQSLLKYRLSGKTEVELAVESAYLDKVNDAKSKGITLGIDQLAILRAQTEEEVKKSTELARQNKMLDRAKELASQYSAIAKTDDLDKAYKDDLEAAKYAFDNGRYGSGEKAQKIYDQTVKGVTKAHQDALMALKGEAINKLGDAISDISSMFKGSMGEAVSDLGKAMKSIAAGVSGDMNNAGIFGKIGKLLGADSTKFAKGYGEVISGVKDIGKNIGKEVGKLFGANGDATKGMSKALGKAAAGAEVGAATASIMKGIGIKTSSTGAQLGGAIGSFLPIPGGSIIGSIVGGIAGGMFKKAKYGTASITMGADGNLAVGSVRGNKASYKANANSAAGSVISGLEDIASQLGGVLSGKPTVSIGQYKGKWRVSNTGRTGKLKGKYSDVTDFGKDGAEDAIAYAIQTALSQGVLTGISEFSKRVLANLDDTDKAVSLAKSYEDILKSLESYNNPIKGAVNDVITSIDQLADQMRSAGATTAELANIEEYRGIKLKEAYENQVSGFNDLLKTINGDASGKSKLTLLNEDLSSLTSMRDTLASGGVVDQTKFTDLSNEILGYAGDLYGTQTSSYQNILSMLTGLTNSAISNVDSAFNAASGSGDTYSAITTQTEQITTAQSQTNDLLTQILSSLKSTTIFKLGTSGVTTANGQILSYG